MTTSPKVSQSDVDKLVALYQAEDLEVTPEGYTALYQWLETKTEDEIVALSAQAANILEQHGSPERVHAMRYDVDCCQKRINCCVLTRTESRRLTSEAKKIFDMFFAMQDNVSTSAVFGEAPMEKYPLENFFMGKTWDDAEVLIMEVKGALARLISMYQFDAIENIRLKRHFHDTSGVMAEAARLQKGLAIFLTRLAVIWPRMGPLN